MSETERENHSTPERCCLSLLTTLFHSLKIFLRNLRLFCSIFALTTLPLSLLLFSLSLSSNPIKSHIHHLEALIVFAPTRVEAHHVWKESRADAISLLRLRALYFVPCYALSLLAAITAVSSTALACSGKRPTLETAVKAVRLTWRRLVVTTMCVYLIMLTYVQLPLTLAALVRNPGIRLTVLVIGSGLEVYLMAVTSMALVVSIVEERFGLDALVFGSGLMEGRRMCGWVFSGLLVLLSGLMGWEMEESMDGHDLLLWQSGVSVGLICLFAWVVLWSYVVTTVFYFECRRKKVMEDESESTV